MFTYMSWTSWVLALLALPVFLYGKFFLAELQYQRQAKANGCAMPKRNLGYSLGFRPALKLFKAVQEYRADTLAESIFKEVGAHTIRGSIPFRAAFFTIDPENVKTVLATSFKDYSLGRRYESFFPLLGNGIFTLSGEGWKHSRAMLRPQFARNQITQLDTNKHHTQVLIDQCKRLSRQGNGVFDIQKLFFELTLDTATEFLFGESVNSLESHGSKLSPGAKRSPQEFVEAFNFCLEYLNMRAQFDTLLPFLNSKEFQTNCKICHEFVDYFVERALAKSDEEKQLDNRYVFIEELTKETRDPIIIRDQAFNILLAGRDTTAGLLSFAFHHLAKDKRVFDKLRAIVLEEFGTGTDNMSFESLKRCQYLNHFVNEVLRLYPVVPFNFRESIQDTILPRGGGPNEDQPVFVPKGTRVFYTVVVMQRNERYWGKDAHEFRPERWEENGSRTWDFVPFNGGPRICLGQQFALTEANYTIVRLLQNFKEIHLHDRSPSGPEGPRQHPRMWSKLTASLGDDCFISVVPA